MSLGKQIRLKRIFSHPSGRLCSVAIDHFICYADGLPAGLRNLPEALRAILPGCPDAVTMFKGAALGCWPMHAGSAALIIQGGCFTPDERVIESLVTPKEVVRLGGDAIAFSIGVRGHNEGRFIRMLSDIVEAAAQFDLPVIAHIYPRDMGTSPVKVLQDAENIAWAVRVGVECGADVIKVAYTGDPTSYGQIVRSSPVPVVAAGGPKSSTLLASLEQMAGVIKSGARGATIGRNIWGQPDPALALRAFKAIIHDDRPPSEAIKLASK